MATYSYLRHEPAIECSGYILRGAGDRMTAEDLPEHWGKFFHKPVKFITVEGSRFFINESFAATLDIIKKINSKNI
jgi:surfactin synthase thioesterase subunit